MKLVAVDKTGSTLSLIDSDTLQTLKRLRTPVAPHDLIVDQHVGRVYVSIYGSGTYGENPAPGQEIVVVDPLRFEQTASISIAPFTSPHGLTLDWDGLLWVSCDAHACLLGIDTGNGLIRRVVGTQSNGTHWVLTSALTGYLYTSNKQDGFLSVIDPKLARLIAMIDVENEAKASALAPIEGYCMWQIAKRPEFW